MELHKNICKNSATRYPIETIILKCCLTTNLEKSSLSNYHYYLLSVTYYVNIAVAQWLRCCATNQKVAGSIPAGVIGIFH